MNPPGKALKRGVTDISTAPKITVDKPKAPKRVPNPTEQSTAPVFRILGLLLLLLGLISMGASLFGLATKTSAALALYGGVGCLFWSALMYAIAEVLVRLGEISAAVRKQARECE
jgi:hypothetical protein